MKMYMIDEERLVILLAQEAELCDLENAGVDNWCRYGEHIELEGYDDYFDFARQECLEEFDEIK